MVLNDMLLGETGYQHNSDKRLQVYLTNSLEESNNEPRTLFAQWLSREATEANAIKRDCPVMVMIGNPPYSISSQNNGKWITNLIADYKKDLNERNIQPLSDDYIKFIRLGQEYVEKNGEGILAYISNNSFIDGITHRQMRQNLLTVFDQIYILDLHGNSRKQETAPDGSKDENVFDIMQGVSINIFVKTSQKQNGELAKVYHQDVYGLRDSKYEFLNDALLGTISWTQLEPVSPYYFFVPKDFSVQEEYGRGFKIDDLMSLYKTGIETGRDDLFISQSKNVLEQKITEVINDNKILQDKYKIKDTASFRIGNHISGKSYDSNKLVPIMYRPFDKRYVYYDKDLLRRPFYDLMKHFFFEKEDNIAICTCRQQKAFDFQHILVSNAITERCYVSLQTGEVSYVFPLYLYDKEFGESKRKINFNKKLYDKIAKGLNYLPCYDDNVLVDPISDYNGVLYPQALFDYIYAVLHSPSYRERYKEFLKIDFPRIPYPTDWEKFRDLAELGEELRQLHLMEDLPSKTGVTFPVAGTLQVDCYRWQDNRVYINAEQYFEGVPESAWNFFIGGYQPAQKWLKDRKGMTLSFEDVKH